MTSEVDIGGVFFGGALITALIACLICFVAGRLLQRVGFYKLVIHRHLVDIALFAIIWACVAFIASSFAMARNA